MGLVPVSSFELRCSKWGDVVWTTVLRVFGSPIIKALWPLNFLLRPGFTHPPLLTKGDTNAKAYRVRNYRSQPGPSLRWTSVPNKPKPCFHGNPVPRMVPCTWDTQQLFVDQMTIKWIDDCWVGFWLDPNCDQRLERWRGDFKINKWMKLWTEDLGPFLIWAICHKCSKHGERKQTGFTNTGRKGMLCKWWWRVHRASTFEIMHVPCSLACCHSPDSVSLY